MDCIVLKKNGNNESIKLLHNVFDVKYNEVFLHQFIVSYISNTHIGKKAQKSRGEVSGSGKKPWRQKGSGRARAGSIRSPLWRGGGKVFASNANRNNIKKINKKMYKFGICMILSQLLRENRLFIFDNIFIPEIKTKIFINEIKFLNININSLFILDNINLSIDRSSRNIPYISIVSYKKINPINLMKFNKIFVTMNSINFLQEFLNEKR